MRWSHWRFINNQEPQNMMDTNISSPGFWWCCKPLIMLLKSDEICSNLLEKIEKIQKGYFSVCVSFRKCQREIKHNKYFQMTCRFPHRVSLSDCHGEAWATDWSHSSQLGNRDIGETLRADGQSHSPTHWCLPPLGRKSYLLNTLAVQIHTHTHTGGCRHIHYLWVHW